MDITVEELVSNIDDYIIVDVRSPKEYESGTIKNAVNLPILDDESRHIIGTLYKQNQEEAYKEGLKVGTSQLPIIYEKLQALQNENPDKKIVIFCFRGGTRSSSVVTVMNLMKINCYKLIGGHKEYRNYVLKMIDVFVDKLEFLVITGNTGVGKTIVLNKIKSQVPVIDLEACANHRGSIFGDLGLEKVTQKKFEDSLFYSLKEHVDAGSKYVFIESESRKIGDVSLPTSLFNKIMLSLHILLDVSVPKRVLILSDVYKIEDLDVSAVKEIVLGNDYFKSLLGLNWINEMISYLENRDFNSFIKHMLVDYYDKLYSKSQKKYKYDLELKDDDLDCLSSRIIDYYKQKVEIR